MRARRLLIPLMMLLLLLPQAQAERLTLYTRPGQVDEATPFQLRPTELSICSVTRAMGGAVVLAAGIWSYAAVGTEKPVSQKATT